MPKDVVCLTQEEHLRLEQHLRQQYQGVFDEKLIQLHIGEFVESSFANMLAAIVAANARRGDRLLDVGAGYGAFVLSCRLHGLDAIGFELAPFEVDMARKRLARLEPDADPQLVFYNGDAGRLPFPNEAFQIVTLLNVLEHVPDYRQVLHEASRVLQPGGRLIVICPNYAAFRREAHYHLPWLPFFPRSLAAGYLRLAGRNPGFFLKDIHYCSNWGVLWTLREMGFGIENLDVVRIEHPELILSPRARNILKLIGKFRLMPVLKIFLRLNTWNPLKPSINIVATKGAN